MRISDWSSDVCSSDLAGFRLTRTVTVGWVERSETHRRLRHRSTVGWICGSAAKQCRRFRAGIELHIQVDRKRAVEGKSVSVRVDLGGRRIIKKTINILQ